MISISFDRPYLLLLAIPLLALILVPYFIAVRKENKTKSTIASLILHLILVSALTLVAAGTTIRSTVTQTQVLVVADVSHSASKNISRVDEYIYAIEDALPDNSEMGVIAFGRNSKTVTAFGDEFEGINKSGVDDSGTDIKSALEYAQGFFDDSSIKRIVLITDGNQTSGDSFDGVIGTIEKLYEKGIRIDAVYLDSNLSEKDREIQITSVDYTPSVYINHSSAANVLIDSSSSARVNATVTLYRDGTALYSRYPTLTRGLNVLNLELPTTSDGSFDYEIVIEANGASSVGDTSDKNNRYTFSQQVSSDLRVLLVSTNEQDLDRARSLYGQNAEIDAYINNPNVPSSIEEIILYDEIILSDVDVRELENYYSFIESIDTAVSKYGKALMTFGNAEIQNNTDEILKDLENMLPVRFGNSDQDSKLVCLVIDSSRSMETLDKLNMAKEAAKKLVDVMNDHDFLIIVTFSGDYTTMWPSAPIGGNRTYLKETLIPGLDPSQGTVLGKGMREAYNKVMESSIEDKQIFLISDGRTWASEEDDAAEIAKELAREGIPTSVLNTATKTTVGDPAADDAIVLLKKIAENGEGNYYFAENPDDLSDIVLADIANDITDSIINADTPVNVKISADNVLDGIDTLPNLGGYIYASEKKSAITVLTADYTKTSGSVSQAPIYSYWNYGKGRVSCFTSSLSGAWTEAWFSGSGTLFTENMIRENLPEEKNDYPYTALVERNGGIGTVTVIPERIFYNASVKIELLHPDGTVESDSMIFTSSSYVYDFYISSTGTYEVKITSDYSASPVTLFMSVPYLDEYDAFASYDISNVRKLVRKTGTVFLAPEDVKIENREEDVATYTFDCTATLMIAAVALYVVDIIIRKLRFADVRNLFGLREKKKKEKGAKHK